jgi:hypothetical protein
MNTLTKQNTQDTEQTPNKKKGVVLSYLKKLGIIGISIELINTAVIGAGFMDNKYNNGKYTDPLLVVINMKNKIDDLVKPQNIPEQFQNIAYAILKEGVETKAYKKTGVEMNDLENNQNRYLVNKYTFFMAGENIPMLKIKKGYIPFHLKDFDVVTKAQVQSLSKDEDTIDSVNFTEGDYEYSYIFDQPSDSVIPVNTGGAKVHLEDTNFTSKGMVKIGNDYFIPYSVSRSLVYINTNQGTLKNKK